MKLIDLSDVLKSERPVNCKPLRFTAYEVKLLAQNAVNLTELEQAVADMETMAANIGETIRNANELWKIATGQHGQKAK